MFPVLGLLKKYIGAYQSYICDRPISADPYIGQALGGVSII